MDNSSIYKMICDQYFTKKKKCQEEAILSITQLNLGSKPTINFCLEHFSKFQIEAFKENMNYKMYKITGFEG